MKPWILLCLAFSFSNASANCNVFIPEKTFYHASGYGINFSFTDDLASKGYFEVTDPREADLVLKFKGSEIKGRFHKAEAQIQMGEAYATEQKTCLTQMCSIYDYGKAFKKAYSSFFKVLSDCY